MFYSIRMSALAASLAVAGLSFVGVNAGFAAEAGVVPSTAPDVVQTLPDGIQAASGLKVFYRKYGRLKLSVDAIGSNDPSHQVKVYKPHKNAKVVKAYLMASSHSLFVGNKTISNGDIKLEGKNVNWMAAITNSAGSFPTFFHSVLADVTGIVRDKMKNASVGNKKLKIKEIVDNTSVNGEVLAVVFQVPNIKKRSVILMFGGQQLTGDRFEVVLKDPIDPKKKNALADMGLGIAHGFQGSGQYSTIDVQGTRLSTAAGGQDDGSTANGTLITAGGIGDKNKNPKDPSALPTGPRDDDELYSLLPLIKKNDKIIRVDTLNPSDDDNIFFAWFELSAKGDVNKDTDGDGLLDEWEKNGYDHDGDGKVDVPLHKMGANWKYKDIFIAYAWMEKGPSETKSHKPSSKVLNDVKKAFQKAPVKNPNGKKGIKVHFKNLGGVPHDEDLNPVWTQFDAIMDPLVSEAERVIYHRMLNGHGYNGGGSSGLSRGIPASDFIETLGKFPSNPGTRIERAGTIMHELGHNLGLRHGGPDHVNYKPNHLSVMSYFNQLVGLRKNGKALLDYERYDLKNLDETALNEKKGLDRINGDGPIKKYAVRYYSGNVAQQKNSGAHKNVDWNNNGNPKDNPVAENLNAGFDTVQNTLAARYPEWANIVYDGGSIGPGAPSNELNMTTSSDSLKELTVEEYLKMQSDFAQ